MDKSNSVLIHIRIGDIIEYHCKDKCFIKKFYYNQNTYLQSNKWFDIFSLWNMSKYINNNKYYHKIAIKLKKLGIINIYIICGSHIKYNNYKNNYNL